MKRNAIWIGLQVVFDSEHGIQTGTVLHIEYDPCGNQSAATIDVPGTQDGAPWKVLVKDLQRAQAAA